MTRTRPIASLAPLMGLLLLAACAQPGADGAPGLPNPFAPPEPPAPEGPPPIPANVLAALPPGVPSSVVIPDGQGCYLYSIERTDPPSGYPLRDAAGNPVCDPGAGPVAPTPTVAGLAADVAAGVPPAPPPGAPVNGAPQVAADLGPPPPPPGAGDTIDITPVLTAPLPGGAAPPPLPAQGSITPPAPLAPLNG